MQTRTRRQREVLDFIVRYMDEYGYQPSYQAIASHIGVSSKAGIARHIRSLEDQGLLSRLRQNGSFSLDINRSIPTPASTVRIQWIADPQDTGTCDLLDPNDVAIPLFMLGNLAPERVGALLIADGSMEEKGICEGDIALIERRLFVRDGNCIAAMINKKEAVLRYYYRDGAKVRLKAADDREEIVLLADKVDVVGLFRGLLRPIS